MENARADDERKDMSTSSVASDSSTPWARPSPGEFTATTPRRRSTKRRSAGTGRIGSAERSSSTQPPIRDALRRTSSASRTKRTEAKVAWGPVNSPSTGPVRRVVRTRPDHLATRELWNSRTSKDGVDRNSSFDQCCLPESLARAVRAQPCSCGRERRALPRTNPSSTSSTP